MYTEIKYRQSKEVAYITLNRPDKLNALTLVMLAELRACLKEIESNEELRIIVVTGEGRAWSAGVDLSVFQTTKVEPGNQIYEDSVDLIHMLETMPQITIAMVNGFTYTGAMEILMAFDLIYAASEAKIGDTHTKWGIPPKWGMTQRLQHQVGLRKAKELSFTAEAINGIEAERIGLINRAIPSSQLEQEVEKVVNKILSNSKQTVSAMKHLYQVGSHMHLKDGLKYEQDYKMEILDKEDDLKNFKKKL